MQHPIFLPLWSLSEQRQKYLGLISVIALECLEKSPLSLRHGS
jgi:hypothetical protein